MSGLFSFGGAHCAICVLLSALMIAAAALCAHAQDSASDDSDQESAADVADPRFEQTPPPRLTFDGMSGLAAGGDDSAPAENGGAPAGNSQSDAPAASSEDEEVSPEMAPVLQELDKLQDESAEDSAGAAADYRRPDSTAGAFMQALFALCMVIAVILFIHNFLRKKTKVGRMFSGSNLGTVIGRIPLNPRVSLHFVRTGGRVLVVGVSATDVSLVAEFDAATFDDVAEEPRPAKAQPPAGEGFLRQLKDNMNRMRHVEEPAAESDEVELASLRGEIRRMQEFLRKPPGKSDE